MFRLHLWLRSAINERGGVKRCLLKFVRFLIRTFLYAAVLVAALKYNGFYWEVFVGIFPAIVLIGFLANIMPGSPGTAWLYGALLGEERGRKLGEWYQGLPFGRLTMAYLTS